MTALLYGLALTTFFFNDTPTPEIYTLSLHDALPICRLNAAEVDIMRTHTTIGAKLLSKSRSPLLNTAREVALYHHERWDGAGYPHGIGGDEKIGRAHV